MTILSLRPSEIFFSQDSIANYFRQGRYNGVPIGQTLDDIVQHKCTIEDIPIITVSLRDGMWYTGDNRRLWVFRKCEELGIVDRVPVREGFVSSEKFTTDNEGVSIRVRGNPGGRIWQNKQTNLSISGRENVPKLSLSLRGSVPAVEHKERQVQDSLSDTHSACDSPVERDLVQDTSKYSDAFMEIPSARDSHAVHPPIQTSSESCDNVSDISSLCDSSDVLEPLEENRYPNETSSSQRSTDEDGNTAKGQVNPGFTEEEAKQRHILRTKKLSLSNLIPLGSNWDKTMTQDNGPVCIDMSLQGLSRNNWPCSTADQTTMSSVVTTSPIAVGKHRYGVIDRLNHIITCLTCRPEGCPRSCICIILILCALWICWIAV